MRSDSTFYLFLVPLLIFVTFIAWRRIRESEGKIAHETVEVRVPRFWFRAVRPAPVKYSLAALTGVSVSFAPLLLFFLGSSGARMFDWRVLTCLGAAYLVPFVYLRFGGLVLAEIWKAREDA